MPEPILELINIFKSYPGVQALSDVSLAVAPGEVAGERLFVVAVSPSYRTDRTVYVGTRTGAFFRSTNGGTTWSLLGQLGSEVRSVVISPTFAAAWARQALPATRTVATTRGEHWIYRGAMQSANATGMNTGRTPAARETQSPDGRPKCSARLAPPSCCWKTRW